MAEPAVAYSNELGPEDVTLTPAAKVKMSELFKDVEDDDIRAIRVFVSGGGCGGMTYGMTFTGERTDYDRVLNAGEFEIYVDTVAYHYLRGVEIDFVERGPGSASFVFNNVFQSVGGTGACSACGAAGGGCA